MGQGETEEIVMLRPISFPPPCGALCLGCEICCDLVVDEHQPTAVFQSPAVCVDRARKSNGDVPSSSNAVQRRPGTAEGTTPRESSIVAKGLAGMSTEKEDAQISREIDASRLLRHGPCARWPGKSCRGDVICVCDVCLAAYTCGGCPRNCALRRARYKGRKLRGAALCCTGRSACCGRSLSPRRRDCSCLAKRSR